MGVFDLVTGANYFSLFSPWPWYVLELAPLALIALGIVALPVRSRVVSAAGPPIAGAATT